MEKAACARLLMVFVWFLASDLGACPKYSRDAQYGEWIDVDRDCQNTRAEVLIRDSQVKVSFRASNPCLVDSGLWFDPYSGNTFRAAADLEIEHVVPVSEAHKSGAWAWTQAERKAFYNFIDSSYYLIPINGPVNSSKGDKDPAEWMPPEEAFWERYAINWIKIKTHWNLKADGKELAALHALLPDAHGLAFPEEAPEDFCTETSAIAVTAPQRGIPGIGRLFGLSIRDLNGRKRMLDGIR